MARDFLEQTASLRAPRLRHRGVAPVTEALAERVIGAAIEVHREIGPGYPESVYENALSLELTERCVPHERQSPFKVYYKGRVVGEGRMDLFVGETLIVEIKAVEDLSKAHYAQTASYLKATKRKLGLLINFNVPLLKNGIKRIII